MNQPNKITRITSYQWSCKEQGGGKESLISAMDSLSCEEGDDTMKNISSPWGRQRGHRRKSSSRALGKAESPQGQPLAAPTHQLRTSHSCQWCLF